MIELDGVTYRYTEEASPALAGVDLCVPEGEALLVVGPSGSGKSTLLRCLDGLVPHFHGGVFSGTVRVHGRDPVAEGPGAMSDLVGFVFQEPEAQFVAERVEDEVAFALENRGRAPRVMAEQVAEVLEALDISHLRHRRVATLSGGERQRVALAGALVLRPKLLVLDEPTSQLDPRAAEDLLELLEGLHRSEQLTVVLAEHRIERVAGWADRVCWLPGSGRPVRVGTPREILQEASGLAPPVLRLGRALGWDPPPLTAGEARAFLETPGAVPDTFPGRPQEVPGTFSVAPEASPEETVPGTFPKSSTAAPPLLEARSLSFGYSPTPGISSAEPTPFGEMILKDVSLRLSPGDRVALMGPNGCGKSTLLKLMVGLLRPGEGEILLRRDRGLAPVDASDLELTEITSMVGFVPQNPARLLFQESLLEEIRYTRKSHGLPPPPRLDSPEGDGPAVPEILARFGLAEHVDRHPFDLSTGERQRAALATILSAEPEVLLLDEPTRGLDPKRKEALADLLSELSRQGAAVLLATHDVELVARWAERVVILEAGRLREDGPPERVLSGDRARRLGLEPQIHRLYPETLALTETDALRHLGKDPGGGGR